MDSPRCKFCAEHGYHERMDLVWLCEKCGLQARSGDPELAVFDAAMAIFKSNNMINCAEDDWTPEEIELYHNFMNACRAAEEVES